MLKCEKGHRVKRVAREYQICMSCVMDTSAHEISFNGAGVCNFCETGRQAVGRDWFPDKNDVGKLHTALDGVKKRGSRFKYDSILGLSGGLDSAVVAKRVVDYGLRPLTVHVDAGWNTEESVRNVRALTKHLELDLETIVIDWGRMRELQLAFLRSGTLNQDIPQDHAFFVSLYRLAMKRRIPVIISGLNYATENREPETWGYSNRDGRHVRSVYRTMTGRRLQGFPTMSTLFHKALRWVGAFRVISPLNYGEYNPEAEKLALADKMGWTDYGGKHSESTFTKWFQDVFLIERYGIDKRRTHLSSKILSGLTTREDALEVLAAPPISVVERGQLNSTVAHKLQISESELEEILRLPHRSHHDFTTAEKSWLCLD